MIDLSSAWSYIEAVAEERLAHNQTSHHVSEYGEDIEVLGAAGELAARRYFGLPSRLHVRLDGGTDFTLWGHSVDVKATRWYSKVFYRYLQWPITKEIRCDFILMTAVDLDAKAAVLLGYATKQDLLKAPINRERAYTCREIPVTNLRPIWELDTMIRSKQLPRSLVRELPDWR